MKALKDENLKKEKKDDYIRFRLPIFFKEQFKLICGSREMSEVILQMVHDAIDGVDLNEMFIQSMREGSTAGISDRFISKSTKEEGSHSENYILVLMPEQLKERFKLFCKLKHTTMSNYLRVEIEKVVRANISEVAARV